MLHVDASRFRDTSHYGPELEQRTLIWHGSSPLTWTEKSSGVSWIGVTGKDSTCVVSMREEGSRPRPLGRRQLFVKNVTTVALAEMSVGVAPDTSTVFRQYMLSHKRPSEKVVEPFAVVSVAPGFVVEENGYEGQPLAVSFLEKRLEFHPSFTSNETTQIAICALKYLLGPKFKSDRIEVSGFGKWEGGLGVMSVDEVNLHLAHEVDLHLAATGLTSSFDSLGLSSP